MDRIARQTTRSTATVREHNTQRRRMGKPFVRKGFGKGNIGSALLVFSMHWQTDFYDRLTPYLMLSPRGFEGVEVFEMPTVSGQWEGLFGHHLKRDDFAAHLTRQYHRFEVEYEWHDDRHRMELALPKVTDDSWDIQSWLGEKHRGYSSID